MLLNVITSFFLLILSSFLFSAESLPQEFQNTSIIENLGQNADLDIELTNQNGERVNLSTYLNQGPIILNFSYFTCPRLCHLIVDGMVYGLNRVSDRDLKNVKILSISFDHRDTLETTKAFSNKYIKTLKSINNSTDNWEFLFGSQEDVKKLADSVGFRYFFNKKSNQFSHSSALIFLSPSSKISRYLYGITFSSFDLSMSLVESKKNNILTTVESILLFCYNYDPDERGYVLEAIKLMKFAGTITILVLGFVIYRLLNQKNIKKSKGF
tara:strand:+ start:120 stop:926 length:807 start_codon:yes stop_codon:yes gene_type:complete